ncbi:hypothetical protein, partial [Cryobacterium sp. TMT2-42-4]
MKPSFIEEQEALGEYFEANAAAVMLAALSLQGLGEERTLTQLTADVFADIILDGVTPSGLGTGI